MLKRPFDSLGPKTNAAVTDACPSSSYVMLGDKANNDRTAPDTVTFADFATPFAPTGSISIKGRVAPCGNTETSRLPTASGTVGLATLRRNESNIPALKEM